MSLLTKNTQVHKSIWSPKIIFTSTCFGEHTLKPFDQEYFLLVISTASFRGTELKWEKSHYGLDKSDMRYKFHRIAEGKYEQFYRDVIRSINTSGRLHTHYYKNNGVSLCIYFIPNGGFMSDRDVGNLDDIDEFCNKLVTIDVINT